jgi:hypothetical protein
VFPLHFPNWQCSQPHRTVKPILNVTLKLTHYQFGAVVPGFDWNSFRGRILLSNRGPVG